MHPSLTGECLIRDYRVEEIAALHWIDGICFPADLAYSRAELRFYLMRPFSIGKVAERDGTILGFAVGWGKSGQEARVITLDVVPEARRCKVGTALMAALHEQFRKCGALQAALEVDAGNEGAQVFYRVLGYERKELLRGYYKGRGDAYRMVLCL
jgi:ribosomal protein S18 acetylase RimI-like enzyme